MKALVYHGPGQKAWEDVPDASIREPTDVVVKVDTTTICGTDLHILHGDVPAVTDGRILGHEAVGTVTEVGATDTVEAGDNTTADVLELTGGVGVDVSIEAVGYPETLLTAASLVRPGGTIANIGVHGVPVSLPMQDMWIQNVTLTMGLVDTVSIPTLLKMVASGRIPAEKMGTHSFTFAQMDEAYDVFSNAAENSALKVVITPS